MQPGTPMDDEDAEDKFARRRSLRLRSLGPPSTSVASVPSESRQNESDDSSSGTPSRKTTRKKRRSTLKDITNTKYRKRSASASSSEEESPKEESTRSQKKKRQSSSSRSPNPVPAARNAVTPITTTTKSYRNDFGKLFRQLQRKSVPAEAIDLPDGVVNLFPRNDYKLCSCDENHCSSQSQSHTFLRHYGQDYFQSLKDWEEVYFPQSAATDCNSSESSSQEDETVSFHSHSGTPPGRVNYVLGSIAAEEEQSLTLSVSSQVLNHQPNLSEKMRAVLVDWLVELSEEYQLSPRTLHLTVTLLNRSLECGKDDESSDESNDARRLVIERDMFQCLGCACMWMASKMEEVNCPSVDDFVYISADSYSKQDITEMEMRVCDALQFRLYQVTPNDFADEFLRASMADRRRIGCPVVESHLERSMVQYLLELSCLPYELVTLPPRKIAAAAIYLSRVVLGIPGWSPTLEHASGLCQWDLEEVAMTIHKYHSAAEASKLTNAFNKYRKSKYHYVALKTVPLEQDLGF